MINLHCLTKVHNQSRCNILGNCILQISIISNLTSALAASAKVFSHLPFRLCHESLHVIRLAIWYCNPLRSQTMWGVTTQNSASKSNTNWMMDLKKYPETCGLAPYLLSIFDILHNTIRAFTKFNTTVINSSSATNITLPCYLKDVTILRGGP